MVLDEQNTNQMIQKLHEMHKSWGVDTNKKKRKQNNRLLAVKKPT